MGSLFEELETRGGRRRPGSGWTTLRVNLPEPTREYVAGDIEEGTAVTEGVPTQADQRAVAVGVELGGEHAGGLVDFADLQAGFAQQGDLGRGRVRCGGFQTGALALDLDLDLDLLRILQCDGVFAEGLYEFGRVAGAGQETGCSRVRARLVLSVSRGQPRTCSPKPVRPAGSSPSISCSEGIS